MNVLNISQFEDDFLRMIQGNINRFTKKKVEVVYRKTRRTPAGMLHVSIMETEREIRRLEEKCRKEKEALKDLTK